MPGAQEREKRILFFGIAALVVFFDQITKAIVLAHLPLYESIPVIPGFFNLTHIQNPGGAFGFLAKQSPFIRHFFFIGVSFFALGLIFYLFIRTPGTHRWLAAAFALIFGGAIGNLIDRVRFGKVVDFLDFHVGSWHWPAFNVADSAVTIGVVIFAYHLLLNKMPE
jgi:signal peptidase II